MIYSRARALFLLGLMIAVGCSRTPQAAESSPGGGEWHDFQGTWIAAGTRQLMRLGGDREASIANYSGSLVLAGPSRPGPGFRADAIVLDDTVTGGIGRAVWTDNHGDRVFSELREVVASSGNKIVGTFIGGTGRFAGATGTYEFTWQFLVPTEGDSIQGKSSGFHGRIRVPSLSTTPQTGGPQS